MTNTKMNEDFQIYVEQQANITEKEIFTLLQEKREVFEDKIIEGIKQLIEIANTTEVSYIHFAILRSHVIDGKYIWYVQLQDKEGDMDFKDVHICIEMSEFFSPLEDLQKKLILESKKYVGKLSEADIDLIKLTEFDKYISYYYLLGIVAFKKEEIHYLLNKLIMDSSIQITIGEYMGTRQIVSIYRKDEKIPYEITQRLYAEIEEDDWKDYQLQFCNLNTYEFSDEAIVCKNMMGSSFINTSFNKMEFSLCNMMFVDFNQVRVEYSDFWNCTMHSTLFRDTTLNNVSFSNCRFDQAEWKENKMTSPGIVETSFGDSILSEVEFVECDLRNCNFSKTSLSNVTFTNCNLHGVIMSNENLRNITLTREQREQLVIV